VVHPLKIADPDEKWVNARGAQNRRQSRVKHWEIIADNLSKAGWSLGWVIRYCATQGVKYGSQNVFPSLSPFWG
jgi:hypothetical protein